MPVDENPVQQDAPAGASRPAPLLSIGELAVSFAGDDGGRVMAVDGLDLVIYPRQTVALVGESGCGKSVTALGVLRLVPSPPGRYERGTVRLEGRDLLRLPERALRRVRGGEIAMIFQEPAAALNPVFTVGEQIVEAIRLHREVSRRDARALAAGAMAEVGIPHPEQRFGAYPHEFSGGMCQRVTIAMALACRPKLLLADEPTTAVDVTTQAQILRCLASLKRRTGMSILLITHDLGVVAQVADVVCVMYAGRAVEYATVFDLFRAPLHPYTRGLFNSMPRLDRRRTRLATVDEWVSDPAEFRMLPGGGSGLTPWWPAMGRPPRMAAPAPGTAGEGALCELAPGHWVACRGTETRAGHARTRPELAFRRRGSGGA